MEEYPTLLMMNKIQQCENNSSTMNFYEIQKGSEGLREIPGQFEHLARALVS